MFREGVNLEVMSDVAILEEMRVDNILVTDDLKIKSYIAKRQSWTVHPDLKPIVSIYELAFSLMVFGQK